MIRSRHASLLLAAVSLACGVAAQESPKHLLRYNFTEGATAHYAFVQKTSTKMKMADTLMDMVMDMQMFMQSEVVDLTESGAAIESLMTRIKGKMSGQPYGDGMEFDSADEEAVPSMLAPMLDMVGATTRLTMNARGKIVGLDLPDSFDNAGMEAINLDPGMMLQQCSVELPDEPVGIGDTWKTSISHRAGQSGGITMDAINELVSVDGSKVTIEQTIDMTMHLGEELGASEVKVEEASARMVIDLRDGLFQEMDMTMRTIMKIAAAPTAMEMTMDMAMEVRRVEPPAKKPAEGTEK